MAEEELSPDEIKARFDVAGEALSHLSEAVEADSALLPVVLPLLDEVVRVSEEVGQRKLGEGQSAAAEGNLEPVTLQEENLLERIRNGVLGRNIHGKLPREIRVGGLTLVNEGLQGGFNDRGPDKDVAKTLWFGRGMVVNQFVGLIYNDGRWKELPDLVGSHIVWAVPAVPEREKIDYAAMTPEQRLHWLRNPAIDERNMVLTIGFFQDLGAPDSRNAYTQAYVQVILPNEVVREVLAEVRKNPDFLEEFYQKVFPGLDAQEGRPGMRRVPADGVYIITDVEFEEAERIMAFTLTEDKLYSRHLYEGEIAQVTQMVRGFFNRLPRYPYANGPYGTGEEYLGEKY